MGFSCLFTGFGLTNCDVVLTDPNMVVGLTSQQLVPTLDL